MIPSREMGPCNSQEAAPLGGCVHCEEMIRSQGSAGTEPGLLKTSYSVLVKDLVLFLFSDVYFSLSSPSQQALALTPMSFGY